MSVTLSLCFIAGLRNKPLWDRIIFHYKHMYSLVLQLSQEKNTNWQTINNSKVSTVRRNKAASIYQYERSCADLRPSMAVGQTNTSRSEPDLAWQRSMPKRSVPPQRQLSNRTEKSNSQFITNTWVHPQPQYTVNTTGQTRTNNQFVCSQIDTLSKTPQKPQVTKSAPKSKGDSGWVRKYSFVFYFYPNMLHFLNFME